MIYGWKKKKETYHMRSLQDFNWFISCTQESPTHGVRWSYALERHLHVAATSLPGHSVSLWQPKLLRSSKFFCINKWCTSGFNFRSLWFYRGYRQPMWDVMKRSCWICIFLFPFFFPPSRWGRCRPLNVSFERYNTYMWPSTTKQHWSRLAHVSGLLDYTVIP